MSVSSGHAKLKHAGQDLRLRWREAGSLWRDDNSRRFQDDYIEPFLAKLKNAQAAMGHMELILSQIRRDCE